VSDLRAIARELALEMRCNCDLDNWEPERSTGHSHVCLIHKAAVAKAAALRRPSAAQPEMCEACGGAGVSGPDQICALCNGSGAQPEPIPPRDENGPANQSEQEERERLIFESGYNAGFHADGDYCLIGAWAAHQNCGHYVHVEFPAAQPVDEDELDAFCIPRPPSRVIGKVYSPEAISDLEQSSYRKGIEDAAAVADEHTPAKHDQTLAAHVTGSTIARAIRALGSGGRP
jgi:hypothetical protein